MYVSIYLSDCLSISLSVYIYISTTSPHVCWLNPHFCLYINIYISFRYSYYVHTIVEAFSFREATLKWMALSMIDFRSCERLEKKNIYLCLVKSTFLLVKTPIFGGWTLSRTTLSNWSLTWEALPRDPHRDGQCLARRLGTGGTVGAPIAEVVVDISTPYAPCMVYLPTKLGDF